MSMTSGEQKGQYRVASLWFNGAEQRRKAEIALKALLREDEVNGGFVLGAVSFEVIDANSRRLDGAKPPESGAQVLAAYAVILDYRLREQDASYIANLDPKDLEELRRATHRAYRKANPGASPLTQSQIDTYIARFAPETAARLTRALH